jgi:large subunit ribosomal protein L33
MREASKGEHPWRENDSRNHRQSVVPDSQSRRNRYQAPLAGMTAESTIQGLCKADCGRSWPGRAAETARLAAPRLYTAFIQEIRAMAKGKKKVETVFLVCDETGDYNYTLRRKSGGEKLKLQKYSPRLRRRTLHTEKKK